MTIGFTYPLDVATTRLMADMGKAGKRNFTSTFDALNAIHIETGRYGIWKGVSIALASIIP